MAAASTPKLQDIVECPICLETLTEPRMFGCFHFYCAKCVHNMKEVKQDETVGYECPLCRKFNAKGQLQALPIMGQILEAINVAKGAGEKCGKCKRTVPTWRCLDCKKCYCDECKLHHDDFELFQLHQWEQCGDTPKAVIDKLEFCDVHPSKPAEIHCRDCKTLICLLCNGTTHKQHTAETIEEALQQILPVVTENQTKVKAMIETIKNKICRAKEEAQNCAKQHDDLENMIKARYDVMMAKLREDCAKLSEQAQASRDEMVEKYKTRVKQLELQLQNHKNVLSLSQSTLDTAQNISLLKALQSGVLDSLNDSLERADTVPKVEKSIIVLEEADVTDSNLLGCVNKQFEVTGQVEISCDDLMKKTFTQYTSKKLDFYCNRFFVINDELWCIDHADKFSIHIHTLEMVKKRTMAHRACGEVRSVVEFNGEALASASNGLFTVSTDAHDDAKKACDGDFCDASVKETQVYALTANASAKVCVLRFDSSTSSLSKQKDLKLRGFNRHAWNTVQVTSDHVFVGLHMRHVIQQYTLNGQFVREHGRHGSGVGELYYPLLSGCDSFNNILIAANNNHRLDVLRADGSFCTLPVTGLDRLFPTCFRIHDGKLYVTLWNSRCIIIYSIG